MALRPLRLAAPGLALLLLTCARIELGQVTPAGGGAPAPTVDVAIQLNTSQVVLGGGNALVVREPDGSVIARISAGETRSVAPGRPGRIHFDGGPDSELPVVVAEDSGGTVRVGGRDYRGAVLLLASASGLTAVNRVDVDAYLAGVVSAEMGRRGTAEEAALLAQAVVSRTVALRAKGRGATRGYDLVATVADQVYGGVAAETAAAWKAVEATRGEVLTADGVLIDAFFGSTCGGRTAAGDEVFAGAAGRAYLRSVADVDPSGTPWCAISPRYHWTVEWTGEELARILSETLAATGSPAPAGVPEDVVVVERTGSGRVASIRILYRGASIPVSGPAVRRVLRPRGMGLLWSAHFDLQSRRGTAGVERLVAEGAGAGHGVGFCQWGAVGRARAGFNYREILAAYFPGTELRRGY